MNICFIAANFWPGWGGAEGQCRLLARELHRRGHEVVVLTRGRQGLPTDDFVDGVAVRRTAARGPGALRSAVWTLTATTWLRRHARQFQVIQCYQLLSPSHVGLLGRCWRGRQATVLRPACSGPYGDVAEVRRLPLTRMRKRLLQRADAFVTLSGDIETELTAFGLGGVPFHRIPNGVDAAVFTPAAAQERRALRGRLGLPADRVLCAFVGRLTPQKDPGYLLEAWALGRFSQAHLVFVGDGPLRRSLETRAVSGPLAGQISFAGPTADVASHLRAADLLVLPSRAEGMSNALLEAMACGIPVIATDVNGNREVVGGSDQVGLLVPPGDPAALAEAIGTLAAAPALRGEMGATGRARVLKQFDIHQVATQYLSLYAELLP